jgi:hypothetical protein
VQLPSAYADYEDEAMAEALAASTGKKRTPPRHWTPDADDALLSAIVVHGVGQWSQMLRDPTFASRLDGFKPGGLRNRWKKLGSSELPTTGPERRLAAKREAVFDNIAANTTPLAAAQAPPQQVAAVQQQQVASASGAVLLAPPPVGNFVSYRPYATHVFDLPAKQQKVRSKDATLATPMNLVPQRPKKRGRRPKNQRATDDEDDDADDEHGHLGGDEAADTGAGAAGNNAYSDDDSNAEEERARAAAAGSVTGGGVGGATGSGAGGGGVAGANGGAPDDFADLDANLDNLAYMYYYDHRNDSLQLYDTFSVPMRDLHKQLTVQYGMKGQDALELMKVLGESRDLYSRRNTLSKTIHAHITHFQTAQYVRQWLVAVRQMTTQHVHKVSGSARSVTMNACMTHLLFI